MTSLATRKDTVNEEASLPKIHNGSVLHKGYNIQQEERDSSIFPRSQATFYLRRWYRKRFTREFTNEHIILKEDENVSKEDENVDDSTMTTWSESTERSELQYRKADESQSSSSIRNSNPNLVEYTPSECYRVAQQTPEKDDSIGCREYDSEDGEEGFHQDKYAILDDEDIISEPAKTLHEDAVVEEPTCSPITACTRYYNGCYKNFCCDIRYSRQFRNEKQIDCIPDENRSIINARANDFDCLKKNYSKDSNSKNIPRQSENRISKADFFNGRERNNFNGMLIECIKQVTGPSFACEDIPIYMEPMKSFVMSSASIVLRDTLGVNLSISARSCMLKRALEARKSKLTRNRKKQCKASNDIDSSRLQTAAQARLHRLMKALRRRKGLQSLHRNAARTSNSSTQSSTSKNPIIKHPIARIDRILRSKNCLSLGHEKGKDSMTHVPFVNLWIVSIVQIILWKLVKDENCFSEISNQSSKKDTNILYSNEEISKVDNIEKSSTGKNCSDNLDSFVPPYYIEEFDQFLENTTDLSAPWVTAHYRVKTEDIDDDNMTKELMDLQWIEQKITKEVTEINENDFFAEDSQHIIEDIKKTCHNDNVNSNGLVQTRGTEAIDAVYRAVLAMSSGSITSAGDDSEAQGTVSTFDVQDAKKTVLDVMHRLKNHLPSNAKNVVSDLQQVQNKIMNDLALLSRTSCPSMPGYQSSLDSTSSYYIEANQTSTTVSSMSVSDNSKSSSGEQDSDLLEKKWKEILNDHNSIQLINQTKSNPVKVLQIPMGIHLKDENSSMIHYTCNLKKRFPMRQLSGDDSIGEEEVRPTVEGKCQFSRTNLRFLEDGGKRRKKTIWGAHLRRNDFEKENNEGFPQLQVGSLGYKTVWGALLGRQANSNRHLSEQHNGICVEEKFETNKAHELETEFQCEKIKKSRNQPDLRDGRPTYRKENKIKHPASKTTKLPCKAITNKFSKSRNYNQLSHDAFDQVIISQNDSHRGRKQDQKVEQGSRKMDCISLHTGQTSEIHSTETHKKTWSNCSCTFGEPIKDSAWSLSPIIYSLSTASASESDPGLWSVSPEVEFQPHTTDGENENINFLDRKTNVSLLPSKEPTLSHNKLQFIGHSICTGEERNLPIGNRKVFVMGESATSILQKQQCYDSHKSTESDGRIMEYNLDSTEHGTYGKREDLCQDPSGKYSPGNYSIHNNFFAPENAIDSQSKTYARSEACQDKNELSLNALEEYDPFEAAKNIPEAFSGTMVENKGEEILRNNITASEEGGVETFLLPNNSILYSFDQKKKSVSDISGSTDAEYTDSESTQWSVSVTSSIEGIEVEGFSLSDSISIPIAAIKVGIENAESDFEGAILQAQEHSIHTTTKHTKQCEEKARLCSDPFSGFISTITGISGTILNSWSTKKRSETTWERQVTEERLRGIRHY